MAMTVELTFQIIFLASFRHASFQDSQGAGGHRVLAAEFYSGKISETSALHSDRNKNTNNFSFLGEILAAEFHAG